jgi:hypothetical protein
MHTKLFTIVALFCGLSAAAQEKSGSSKNSFVPFAGVLAGGCVDNPVAFMAGADKALNKHLTLTYDVHFWNTGYECYCADIYSVGKYTSFTPSVKLSFSTGRQAGRGLIAGVGLGYMFARDRGTEQTYTYDGVKGIAIKGDKVTPGNWDFNSLAPSVTFGLGVRILKLPVTFHSTYYFANTTEGWMPAAGGVGLKLGFRAMKAK